MSDNEEMIAEIGDRLRHGQRPETEWSPAAQDWLASRPHGNVAPPDVVLAEIGFRLSSLSDTYLIVDDSK